MTFVTILTDELAPPHDADAAQIIGFPMRQFGQAPALKALGDAKIHYMVTVPKADIIPQKRIVQNLRDMLTDLDEWHSLASGTAISNFPAESEVNEDGEIMDDAEMFEKMEKERVYAADPDSVAFFQAQKTRNANMTQNSLAIKQMRKNKRSVGGGN